MGAPYPQTIPEAFAIDAAPTHRNDIPPTTVNPQRASWSLGFPPQTMTPIIAGGKPMLGPDMNGTLYMLSSHTYYAQTGQPYRWNADVVVALVTGYAAGTLLGSTDGATLWLNIQNNNTSDPDAGGAGWVPMFSYGMTALPPTNGGVINLTAAQARMPVIIVSGALVSNLQINFPTSLRRWLVVNNTSGGFATTAKTAGGTGVNVPQGGFASPTEVYGDGVNLYNIIAPTVIPGDVAPTPNTFAVRSNAGYLFATYLNQNSPVENFAVSEVFAGIGDGYLRKIGRLNFAGNLLLSWLAGQVTDGQVPLSAVNQHRATILNDSALTGTPTAPTPPVGDNSARVATTAFVAANVQASAVSAQSGQLTIPIAGGGFPVIIKWGFNQNAGGFGNVIVNFATPFPHACWMAVCTNANRNTSGSAGTNMIWGLGPFGFNMINDVQNLGAGAGTAGGYWIAIGN
jgi:hypothetical protein